jgi:hypothetical protein
MNNISKIGFAIIIFAIAFTVGCSYDGELVYLDDGSNVYHRDDCKFVEDANQVYFFNDLEETVDNHYRPCKTCNPPDNKDYAVEKIQELTLGLEELNNQNSENLDILKEVVENFVDTKTRLVRDSSVMEEDYFGRVIYDRSDDHIFARIEYNKNIIENELNQIYGEINEIAGYDITEFALFYERLYELDYDYNLYKEINSVQSEIKKLRELYNIK